MRAEPARVQIAPGPGSCGTITLGGASVLAYRLGAGPAGGPPVAVTLTNQPGPIPGVPGAELWVPSTWTAGGADGTDGAAGVRPLPGPEPSFTSDALGGAEVTVLLPAPAPASASPAAAARRPDSAADAGEDPPFHESWIRQQREMRLFLDAQPGERPQLKVSGHGNVVKAIREQVDRGRALAAWRAESATALVVLLRTSGVGVLVGGGLDADAWLALRAEHRSVLRDVDLAVVRVSPLPLRHLPSYFRTVFPRASAIVDAGHPGRQWPACDPTPLEVLTTETEGAWTTEARTR